MDKIFKIGLLVLGVAFLFLYSQKGRYQTTTVPRGVIDTYTGAVYDSGNEVHRPHKK